MFLNEFKIKIQTNFFIEILCINTTSEHKATYDFLKDYDFHYIFKQINKADS